MKYCLIGPYPPPLGGVSVYIYRFAKLLRSQGHTVDIIDVTKQTKIQKLVSFFVLVVSPQPRIFCLNGYQYLMMVGLILRPFKSRYILYDHSGRMVEKIDGLKRIIFRLFLRRTDECFLVGKHLYEYYKIHGYKLPDETHVQHAFLPPPLEDEAGIWCTYNQDTLKFVEEHKPLIVANAFQITFYQGIDLYGIDLCVELVSILKNEYPRIGLLFALAEIGDVAYFESLNQKIDALSVREHFYFMTGQKELWPLFKKADIMLRPTYVDGYGISVAEALWFGCPAIASDVCERTEGTILFRNRDVLDLVEKVKRVLQ